MLTVICVLKSGGIYDLKWVDRLRNAVARHLSIPHYFDCLSDVPVPVNRIPLKHNWPGWWSKIELYRPGLIKGPTIYFDLDVIITGSLDAIASAPYEFAMLSNLSRPLKTDTFGARMVGSSVIWFKERAPAGIYEKFAANPDGWIKTHRERKDGPYLGDQAFVWDALGRKIDCLQDHLPGLFVSYKKHCRDGLPKGAAVVNFHGKPKQHEVADEWVRQAWA
jgi:hypothetical protein